MVCQKVANAHVVGPRTFDLRGPLSLYKPVESPTVPEEDSFMWK